MKAVRTILFIFCALALPFHPVFSEKNSPSRVTTKDNRIYVNGKLFFVKGICYNPFFPGKGQGPITFEYLDNAVREKDFLMMKEAGFNTIRIYAQMPPRFYDMAWAHGLRVIEPVVDTGAYSNVRNARSLEDATAKAVSRVQSMKDHPSILMWSLWNDAPFRNNIVEKYGKKSVNDFFKKIYDAVKAADRDHPVTGANMINVQNGWDMGFRFLDVIGCNSYIGLDYNGNAWNNANYARTAARRSVTHMSGYARRHMKPVVITELGCPTHVKYDRQGRVLESQFKVIGERLAGVCVFEWTDEWWKAGDNSVQDAQIEDHWGILNATRGPKPGYDVVKKYFRMVGDSSQGFRSEMFRR
jgi:exo-beta-1,3-glucanase (GH17 family)